ncbi:thioesterase II family protein [Chitinophaga sp. ARDCPP14]|uniref:thioesterase II family protein n=1 Tax=Chitinophaga sp. ARDCPP14 TaxID=3391139 RepID=UPI003F51D8E2
MSGTQLFVIHFAGGSSYSFKPILSLLEDIDIIPVELPGRGRRMAEPLLVDFEAAALDLFNKVLDSVEYPGFLLYGHSMGASLAFKVCSMLEEVGESPGHLIVSGNAGPGIKAQQTKSLLADKDLIEAIRKMGGIPAELLDNRDFLHFILPILRADFHLSENCQLSRIPPVNTPIWAIMGNEEENAGNITNWKAFTRAGFKGSILPGGHFFIDQHPEKMAEIITDCIKSSSAISK